MPDPKDLPWYALSNPQSVVSPALLVYPDRIDQNIAEMVRIAGNPERLRPHIKTHKTAEIIQKQQQAGISRFKCATIAEAELLGRCGAEDVLLAYQPVGPDQRRLLGLVRAFPQTRFSALLDHRDTFDSLASLAAEEEVRIGVFLDLNVGMDRTGIRPGDAARDLYAEIAAHPALEARGLHAYDGHLRHPEFADRKAASDAAFAQVETLRERLESLGLPVPAIIAGGSPTFPVHALRPDVELSPGTTLLWDARYGGQFPDMAFEPAAVLFSRVISKPAPGTLCLDLGHKAVAPEMNFPRVSLLNLEGCTQVGQSEEHLVLKCDRAEEVPLGREVYALPMHVCPTVAKYPKLLAVRQGSVTETWEVAARDYQITI